jgi:hypothetical protein
MPQTIADHTFFILQLKGFCALQTFESVVGLATTLANAAVTGLDVIHVASTALPTLVVVAPLDMLLACSISQIIAISTF